jgi:putative SOS response-associated peptidase YedK
MCGRMTLTKRDLAEIADELAAVFDPESAATYRPRYNLAPTDPHFVLRVAPGGQRRLEPARWGLVVPGRPPLFNARAESAAFKPPFRDAWRDGRCVVPADGFYEWRSADGQRQPLWFHRRDGKLLLLAGLCAGGRFTVLTTTPNALLATVHDRMPAVLTEEEAAAWLAAPSPRLLHPAAEDLLEGRPVSTRVNAVRNDDPECLAPPPAQPRQLTLV